MKFSTTIFLIAYIVFHETYSLQFDVWGDLRDTNLIVSNFQTKYALPFIKRTMEISYPEVSSIKFSKQKPRQR